jgi:DNA-binding CsgD family transcriptional regulator
MMQFHGAWLDAMHEAQRACEQCSEPPVHPAAGEAFYQQAEVYRLRGDFAQAEDAYRQASQFGRDPYPGLAQLRLAQGQADAAATAIRLALDASAKQKRPRVLPPYVEIMLAVHDLPAARAAADELATIAVEIDVPFLHAVAAHATGAVLLAAQDARGALTSLRRAWALWRELDAPYEMARARTLVAVACRSLGDIDGANLELDAARQLFSQLGAAVELARLERFAHEPAPKARSGLSAREVEVLRLVATGKTNRGIAEELRISEKTVARHVSNIFVKLNLSTRAAATAYAYQHDLR